MNEDASLIEHLEELRGRLIFCLVTIVVASSFCYAYVDVILRFLSAPAGMSLIYTSPTEAFMATLKLAIYSGLFVSMPVLFFHVIRFSSPGLLKNEKRLIFWMLPVAIILFIGGVLFAYYLVLPVGLQFLLSYQRANLQAMISVSSYISFVMMFLLSFGLVFEFPLAMILLSRVGLVNGNMLRKNRKYAIVVIFIAAAILTPGPDVFSQFMMAIPLWIVYEISLIIIRFAPPRRNREFT